MLGINHIGVIATYSEMQKDKKPPEEIIELMHQLPLLTQFIILSQLSTQTLKETEFRAKYKNFSKRMFKHLIEKNDLPDLISNKVQQHILESLNKNDKSIAFSPQSILNLWKWFLAYGNSTKAEELHNIELSKNAIYHLALMTNDYLYDGSNKDEKYLWAEIFCNSVFNNKTDIALTIVRTFLIYTDIATNASYYGKANLDINKDFEEKYGYTIKQYLAILFGITGAFVKPTKIGEKWLQSMEEIFSNTKLQDISSKIIPSMTTNFEAASKWALKNIDSPWNFQHVKEKPLLCLTDNHFLPFSVILLAENFFDGLFYKVRNVYPYENTDFLGFYGKPFERYAQLITEKSLENKKIPYELIPEFRYSKTKVSPDIMLRLGNKLLAIEVKSYRLSLSSFVEANVDSINYDMNKFIIEPMLQLHKRLKELIEIQNKHLSGIDEIYTMVITQDGFPTLAYYEDIIKEKLSEQFTIPVKGFFHLDIEEYEMLCALLERKRPLFKILENKKLPQNHYLSFKNFMLDIYKVKRANYIDTRFQEITAEIRSLLF